MSTPNSGGLYLKVEEVTEEVARIEKAGGLAWSQAEYGPDMGQENVYWGHRVYFFTPEQVKAASK